MAITHELRISARDISGVLTSIDYLQRLRQRNDHRFTNAEHVKRLKQQDNVTGAPCRFCDNAFGLDLPRGIENLRLAFEAVKPSGHSGGGVAGLNLVAGPGFEGGPLSTTKRLQELTSESFEEWQRAKTA
jgi:hypothetical protein